MDMEITGERVYVIEGAKGEWQIDADRVAIEHGCLVAYGYPRVRNSDEAPDEIKKRELVLLTLAPGQWNSCGMVSALTREWFAAFAP
jgi:hypothetical protein